MADRVEMLVGAIDVRGGKGLELGPLAKPVVTREQGDIRYLDHVDTAALRARYRDHAGFDVDAIVDIDYALGDRSMLDAVGDDAPFDYVVASHVVEHVPDLVRWLDDVRSVLRDGGTLSLAIPDHRCCFDALREPTVAADVVAANLAGAVVPSPRQVYDHYSSAVAWHGLIAWDREPPIGELVPVHSEQEALTRARTVCETGVYDDVHCWVFTPSSFRRLAATLQRLGLVRFALDRCTGSIGGEFFATLRACSTEEAAAAAEAGDVVQLRGSEHAAVRASLASVRTQLTAIERSRSWRLTEPLRRVNRWRGRRADG